MSLTGLGGCGSSGGNGTGVIVARQLDADQIGKQAMEQYDTNGDGKLDAKELNKSLALKSIAKRVDSNQDGALTADEIATRIREYQKQSDILALSLTIKKGTRPLVNAEVVFEPEPFYGEGLMTFKGVTNSRGNVSVINEDASFGGLPIGLYKVHITGPVTAELGCEVAEDSPTGSRMTLVVKKK